jgi:putative ubiquitin-RnfH superfamily antitoxin RatB of RatAB toxin-antitoxin module
VIEASDLITVEVVYAKPEQQCLLEVRVLPGTTMLDVIVKSGILDRFPEIDIETADVGIFGRVIHNRLHVVHPFDRVEIYRPLPNDPKDLRAERARAQRERGKD